MNDRIGIDTHGYNEPPDEPEMPQETIEALNEIEDQITELVNKFHALSGEYPLIWGYKRR